MKSNPDISIIIPFYNEAENLPLLGRELSDFTAGNPDLKFEIILVNDGSSDNSIEVASGNKFPEYSKLISLSRNFGSHAALRAGVQVAAGNFICFLYADLQDPVENVILMYNQALKGHDIVWGVRSAVESGIFEKLFSRFYAILMKRFVNPNFPEKGFDIVMFSKKVALEFNKNIEAHSSVFLQLLNLGFSQSTVSYRKKNRSAGKSKWTPGKKIKLFIDSFVAFSFAPIRFVTIAGLLIFLLGVFWTTYITFRKIFYNDLESGWPMLTSILFLGFGLTNISLGIIAEYLWRALEAGRNRPVYIIEKVIELN